MIRIATAGDSARKKLDKLRAEIVLTEQEIETLRRTPCTVDEATARFLGSLDQQRRTARFELSWCYQPRADRGMPAVTLGLLAELLPDFEQRARDYFAATIPDTALPSADREQQVAAAEKRLKKLRADEIAELVTLEQQDIVVDWPDEVPLDALLGTWS